MNSVDVSKVFVLDEVAMAGLSVEELPGWKMRSAGVRGWQVVGSCMESINFRHGDFAHSDLAGEIKSGDLIAIEDAQVGFMMKRIEAVKLTNPATGKLEVSFWLTNDHGWLCLNSGLHKVLGPIILLSRQPRDRPIWKPELYELPSAEWLALLRIHGAPALAAFERDGPDRTTVYRPRLPVTIINDVR